MITTIIFDFGDIFINLNKEKSRNAFAELGLTEMNDEILLQNDLFEKGGISENEFLKSIQKHTSNASISKIKAAWNAIIGDFPLERLEFLQLLSQKYKLFLLTNTDQTHIQFFEEKVGISFYSAFYQCFEKVYFSYEMRMRKPDPAIYSILISNHNLSPKNTLFVDDKLENTEAAKELGIQVWNLQLGIEEVTQLFDKDLEF